MLDEFAGLVAARDRRGRRVPRLETAAVRVRRVSDGRARKSRAARSARNFRWASSTSAKLARRRGRGARNDAPRAEQRRQAAAALRRSVRRAVRQRRRPRWRSSGLSGSESRSSPTSIRRSGRTSKRATRSSRSSRIWRRRCAPTASTSTRRPHACSRSRIGSRCSSRLKRKYGPALADVIAKRDALSRQLDALETRRRAARGARGRDACGARTLSGCARARCRGNGARRRSSSPLVSRRSSPSLAMGRTQFEFRFDAEPPESAWTETGVDVAECYISANVGEDLRPLARIASGGELSRVMLAIRTLAAAGAPGKTLIFDEIDAGIGGRVADVVGKKLRAIGESFQVLCITHLPQIAAAGHAHFHISKTRRRTAARTPKSSASTKAERVEELARMIGGAAPTDAARAAARELLGESEAKSKAKAVGGESETSKRRGRRSDEEPKWSLGERERAEKLSMKYFIETYGCQMNVHDSERMAGLLEQAGYEATQRAARRRCRRDQHLQRARARRREALHASRRDSPGEQRDRPHARCRRHRLRGAAGRRRDVEALEPDRRHRRHAEPEAVAGARRTGDGR